MPPERLQTVIKNAPKNSEAHYALGVAFEKLGYLERAESEWREALRLRPDLLDAQRALAGAAMRQGDMNTLEEAANEIIALYPHRPMVTPYALFPISIALWRSRTRYSQGDRRFPSKRFRICPDGNLKFVQKQYGDAAKAYQDALDRNSDSTDALRGLMNTYAAENQVDKAIAAANRRSPSRPSIAASMICSAPHCSTAKKISAERRPRCRNQLRSTNTTPMPG